MIQSKKWKTIIGIIFALGSGTFWGMAGVFGKYLFNECNMSVSFLTAIRLPVSGLLVLLTAFLTNRKESFVVWKSWKLFRMTLFFGLIGMLMTQFTFYKAVDLANAGTATVLQYTAPAMILVYTSIRNKKLAKRIEIIALLLAMAGIFFLATHGNPSTIVISTGALICGLASAIGMVIYNLYPAEIMKKYGASTILGWGMLIAGVVFVFYTKPWIEAKDIIWSPFAFVCLFMVTVMGTAVAFGIYMVGVQYIGAPMASILGAVEVLVASVGSVVFMGAVFEGLDILGLVCIVLEVILLSISKIERK